MVPYGFYEYSETEVGKVAEYLKDCARQGKVVHYDDTWELACRFGQFEGPHDKRLWDLLGLISETEVKAGRCALSAIVVLKNGPGANRPGSGFFELEKHLGRYKRDDDTTWLAEVDGLFKYWGKH